MTTFQTVALIGRRQTEGVADTLIKVIEYLQQQNIKIMLEKETAIMALNHDLPVIDRNDLKNNCDLIIVVGGDGSMLTAARIAADQGIPVVGVNRGTLGFLTDILPDDIESLGKILAGDFKEEQRFLLSANIKHEDHILSKHTALNDVVLLPSETNRMIEFCVFINNKFMCNYRADGMIVATPTGSTAHSLSGGGPILHPGLDAIVLLPMFSHNLSSRPIVVEGDSAIEIVMAEECRACPNISCDGQALVAIPSGARININKHPDKFKLIHLSDYNYFETLRAKLHWES